ncbi:efflux RND transporter periplasmic adaptor subunit [Undibacterium seohonense]|uniref:Efflux RND transporter periplasmic adaptor subunit n=1 Tax=Undibacterium seohonense TaxID=1344950 RepID=A0ABR6X550_9BURK|nr:efflux RND transporter periplasmic adaptor subunit [Undibacterium seohonense]MBC3807464.1 efflux RND transporter periplasmic adaptor subunit [Undibacterium seohonense]
MKMVRFFLRFRVLTFAIILAGCEQEQSLEKSPTPQVVAVLVESSPLIITEDLPGRVAPLRVAEIRPQVSGIVQQRLFEQGREVRAGQALFQIHPATFIAERDIAAASLRGAEAALARAKLQAQRLAPLVEIEAVSRQVYDDAVSQREQASADVAQANATLARRQLDLKFAKIEAPISGRIDQALVTEGALVASTDSGPMARIQQIDKVYVDVRRPAASLDTLQKALSQGSADIGNSLPVKILLSNGDMYESPGQILFTGINVDSGTGDVLLRVQVENPKRQLLPGMFVQVRVPLASYGDALTVPQQSVVRLGGKAHVWTIDSQNLAQLTPVEVGELSQGNYRVVSGLKKGQRIAIDGMERLSDGLMVKLLERPVEKTIAR